MRINHNLSAVVANNRLHLNEDMVASSMERLSTGLRLNHSKDDPAGMAISKRMTTQIDGLDQASQNANDATSLIQTTDGALGEMTEIIQRMRELAVQAANDTNADSDKEAIQREISELKKEIDRMSKDTEFNTKGLLNGSLDNRVYSSKSNVDAYGMYIPDMDRIETTDNVPAGKYEMLVNSGTKAVIQAGDAQQLSDTPLKKITADQAGTIEINGYRFTIEEGDTYGSALQKFQRGAEKGEMTVGDTESGSKLTLTSTEYGSAAGAEIIFSNKNLSKLFGFSSATITKGTDAIVSVVTGTDGSCFEKTATVSTVGNRVTINQPNGFSMSFLLADNLYPNTASSQTYDPISGHTSGGSSGGGSGSTSGSIWGTGIIVTPDNIDEILAGKKKVSLEVTTMGSLQVQIGANENQTTRVRIPKMDLENLYLENMDVTTITGADRAIASLDWALQKVSDTRAKIGAYENRMEHSIAFLDQTGENLTSAYSRIADVDMAEEMTRYTSANVLVQAATSVLAQANDIPEQTLQLLQ